MGVGDLLKFRCTGCGNCCREPLLPLTDADVRRISAHTGDPASEVVRFVARNGIDMDDEPEAFAILREGRRVMVLRHARGGCMYLGADARCTIYGARPLGCRIFPFDPTFDRSGRMKRLKLIQATECRYELDGANDPDAIRRLHGRYEEATRRYHEKIAEWNGLQRKRKREGRPAQSARQFLAFLGLSPGVVG
ncbi:MAG TPA: YkgJ family cysteine cluster protein [Polyangiaceae bacterium]